ncbi:MAG: immunity 26/phosphotriesterase HocA family protein [Lachnospiraceae bacterium]|nr:immunity 26/phosphotriesterase HocA family protein [Lachnospiraceae bacterium]
MDEKAKKILKKYKPWKTDAITDEELQYAIEQGVLYPIMNISHENVILEVKRLSKEIDLNDTIRAFLYSLSTGANEYRTALASLLYAKLLPEHDAVVYGPEYDRKCAICGVKMEEEQSDCEIKNSDYNSYRYFPNGYQMIGRADYVLFDLQQFQLLPKVDFTKEDLRILNRIFGLAEELAPANKVIALQKMITTEKVLPANKNEIYVVLSVLSACGVFDTPEHKGYADGFVLEQDKEFVYEYDIFYPLHFWRGKHGINYDAVKQMFGELAGDLLDKEHIIHHEVSQNTKTSEGKKSKAEAYFKEGEYAVYLTNEQRYYYGLLPLSPDWEKVVRYSVTHGCYKRSEVYFDGTSIKKIIYEEKSVKDGKSLGFNGYSEFDLDAETEDKTLLLPKSSRGKKKPWTPSLLMTSTYIKEHLLVSFWDNGFGVGAFNNRNEQKLPLPKGNIKNDKDFQKYTKDYIRSLPENYDEVLSEFHNKKRITVKIRPGDIFRVALSPNTYTYGLILGIARDVIQWDKVPSEHPMQMMMAQPIMFRQYDIVTTNPDMSPEDLEAVPMYPMDMAQDNEILWGTYPVVGHKTLTPNDIDLGFACHKKTGEVFWGFTSFTVNPEIYQEFFEDRPKYYLLESSYPVGLFIQLYEKMPQHITRNLELRKIVLKELGMPLDSTVDDFAKRFGGPTREEYIRWVYR